MAQTALATFFQVWPVQDRLPPRLPVRGEGLPPLCPPAQVPRTEHSHLTQSPVPTSEAISPGYSLKVSQLSPLSGRLRCDQSMSLPEGAFDDALHWLQEVGTPAAAPCLRCWWGPGFALIRLQLTSLTGHLCQGCSHTVEIRLGAHFQIHIPD